MNVPTKRTLGSSCLLEDLAEQGRAAFLVFAAVTLRVTHDRVRAVAKGFWSAVENIWPFADWIWTAAQQLWFAVPIGEADWIRMATACFRSATRKVQVTRRTGRFLAAAGS